MNSIKYQSIAKETKREGRIEEKRKGDYSKHIMVLFLDRKKRLQYFKIIS